MNIRTVFGRLLKIDNTPWANERVVFVLNKGTFTTDATYLPDRKITTTDAEGNFSIDLWTNAEGAIASTYNCILPSLEEFDFTIAAGGPVSIEFLRSLQTPNQPTPQTVLDFVEDYINNNLPLATPTNNGLQSAADKSKLDGIQAGATANATNAQLRDRSTHTGTQAISTVTGLQSALDGKINSSEKGQPNGVASLQANGTLFDNQIPASITRDSELTAGLATKADSDHTHSDATTIAPGFLSVADKTKLEGIQSGATANSSDAQLRDRSTHTGSQPISTVTGLETALDGKANLSGATFTGGIQVPSAVVTTGSSGISLWHGGDSATPVVLSTYNATGSERGLSVPQLRCTNGRIDINPLSNAAEFRITGASTQLRFWNSTNASSYLTINSDRSVNFFNTLNSAGRMVVADTTASTSSTTGSAIFSGGVGIAGSLNLGTALSIANGGTGATTAAQARTNLGITQEFHFIQSAVPSSPSNRERWLEVDSNGTPIGQWYWDSTLSLWLSIAYVPFSGSSTTTALGTSFRPSVPINPGYTGLILEQMSIRCWSSVAHSSSSFFNISASRLNLNNSVSTTISSSAANTQTLAAGVEQEYIIPLSVTQFTWPNFAGFQHNIQIGSGSPTMTFITNVRARYYR